MHKFSQHYNFAKLRTSNSRHDTDPLVLNSKLKRKGDPPLLCRALETFALEKNTRTNSFNIIISRKYGLAIQAAHSSQIRKEKKKPGPSRDSNALSACPTTQPVAPRFSRLTGRIDLPRSFTVVTDVYIHIHIHTYILTFRSTCSFHRISAALYP